jgi:hypothetical protein
MSKKSLITIGGILVVVCTACTLRINAPVAHASTIGTSFFSSFRFNVKEKISKEIQSGKENAAKNRDERNAMLAAHIGIDSTSTPASLLAVSWQNLTNIESWMVATTTTAQGNGADISKISPLLDSAESELGEASSSINILTSSTVSSSTAMDTATSSIDSAKTDLTQALELLKTIVNN